MRGKRGPRTVGEPDGLNTTVPLPTSSPVISFSLFLSRAPPAAAIKRGTNKNSHTHTHARSLPHSISHPIVTRVSCTILAAMRSSIVTSAGPPPGPPPNDSTTLSAPVKGSFFVDA